MRLSFNQFLALVYADLFDFPLTPREALLWSIDSPKILPRPCYSKREVKFHRGYLYLSGRKNIINKRLLREKYSKEKLAFLQPTIGLLSQIPSLQAIFITGSLSLANASKNSDIDLMIISKPNTLWLTRFFVVSLLKLRGQYRSNIHLRDKICPNIFLDTNHLEIKDQNLYTAHEILQAKCLYDSGGVEKNWLEENKWTKDYLPNAYKYHVSRIKYYAKKRPSPKYMIHNTLYIILELIAFILQYLYMRRKITSERVGWGFAFFHPRKLSEKTLASFHSRLRQLGIQV